MKIGYPCINTSIGCTANSTFRLKNYSEDKFIKRIEHNLKCLKKILEYNFEKGLLFFRVGSGLIPFASHPICKFSWQKYFQKDLEKIGEYIKQRGMRISMHPDQFTLINAKKDSIFKKSIKELEYHCEILDLMKLDSTAKIQIHIGGVYGDKKKALEKFIKNYNKLPLKIKRRLVIENDDKSYSLKDCLEVNRKVKIPIVFDSLHHACLNNGEAIEEAVKLASETWDKKDGKLMVDYSSQKIGARKGSHIENVDLKKFKSFFKKAKTDNFDIMLEIKDKEKSALKVLNLILKK